MRKTKIIKKILLIIVFSCSITYGTFHIHQKKAEAIAPWVLWAAVNIIPTIVIGTVLYLTKPDHTQQRSTVASTDPLTGAVTLTVQEDFNGNPGITFYTTPIPGTFPAIPIYWDQTMSTPFGRIIQTSRSDAPLPMTQAFVDEHGRSFNADYGMYKNNSFKLVSNGNSGDFQDTYFADHGFEDAYDYAEIMGGLGGSNVGLIAEEQVELFDFAEDLNPPEPDCFDGIMNQDETGIDCGGICATNYGLVCSVADSCFDGIMNQDETGVDCGGVCMPCVVLEDVPNDDPVPQTIVDANNDGIDDITGYDPANPTITGGQLPAVDPGFYNTTLPGGVGDVGETDWGELIMSSLSANPLIALATGTTINLTNAECTLTGVIYGKNIEIDFCSLEWMVDIFGVFVLLLFTIRSIFVALGVQ
jgi:hypothetical protein